MAERNRQRRKKAKAVGICQTCNADPVELDYTQCKGCRDVERIRRVRSFGTPGRPSRFTVAQVAHMSHQAAQGRTAPAIAKDHGCSASTILRLIKGEIRAIAA